MAAEALFRLQKERRNKSAGPEKLKEVFAEGKAEPKAAEADLAAAELEAALAEGDATALSAAIAKADEASVDRERVAVAKKAFGIRIRPH